MLTATSTRIEVEALFPSRYRSLITLTGLAVIGSLISSIWLLPSRLERVAVAVEQGAPSLIRQELDRATTEAADPGEVRALVDVALTIGSPELAASIVERLLAARPNSVEGLRLLLEVQRQRHLMHEVAVLDERIYAITGDAETLREAADIYASRHMATERVGALRRLAMIGRATAADLAELTHRLAAAGDGGGALTLLMSWLSASSIQPLSAELVGLAAGLSATTPDATAVARTLGTLIGQSRQTDPLDVLIQTYSGRGHPELSLVAGYALGNEMMARPDVALVLAQLEAFQGKFGAARERLETMARSGELLPTALPMLADVTLQMGDLRRAVSVIGSLQVDQIGEGLAHRAVEAVEAAGQADLLAELPIDLIAASSPASAASVALAQGNRPRAISLARAALAPNSDPADFGPAFGRVIRKLGLEREAIARLLSVSRIHPLDDELLSLLIQFAETARTELPSLLDALLRQRDDNPRAGVAWSLLAARNGQSGTVASWLTIAAPRLPAQALIDLLLLASERRDPALARAAAAAGLADRADLPAGWSQAEIAQTLQSNDPLTIARLRNGLDLIGDARRDPAAKDRITARLLQSPQFVQVAQAARVDSTDPAIEWLTGAIATGGASASQMTRLTLLTAIAPGKALPYLADRSTTERQTLTPLRVVALLRTGQANEAQSELRTLLRALSPAQQDAKLHEVLAFLPPAETLPVLRLAASATARGDWVTAYDEALVKVGLIDELRASLRTRAVAASGDPKRLNALASRLVELNDRTGAVAVMLAAAAGKKPDSPEVEQLMYLWGPRDAPDAVAWTTDQALAASAADLPKWLEHLAYLGNSSAVVTVAERRPAILSQSAASIRAYEQALTASGRKAKLDLRTAIESASRPDQLTALAQLALGVRQPALAWQAARASLATMPRQREALLIAAQAASALRRSDDAASSYLQLLAIGAEPTEIYVDAGDALLTAKRAADGRRVLETALGRLPLAAPTIAAARLRARTLSLLGRKEEATAVLNPWRARLPNHDGLKADLLQLNDRN